ncbi:enamelin [Sinocyclocheilus grahami]|uniref:enamelin n=1 Tax=Sinocyclocheilus grahami TaxID=75366 RepID=UPI0007AD1514|nr:PREDICTED: fruit protein pKIWI501-like [Sinocyclocheilus grahami]
MKVLAFLMCLLGSSLAAPAPDSGSNEQAIIGHANTALQLMELYRMLGHLQQQGFGAVPTGAQLPAAPAEPAPADAQPQVSPQAPQQGFFFNPALFAPTGDGSDEEGVPQFRGFYPPYGYQPAQPAAPLNSDEAEVAEEAEGAEAAEAAEAGAEPEPAGTAATVDATAVNEIAPVDVAIEAPVEPVIAAVVPSLIPEVPAVAVEIDTALVGPDAAAGAEQVLVADAPDAALPVQ